MASIINNTTNITLDPAKTYYLTTIIGNGQMGNSAFQDPAGNQVPADLNAVLGSGSALKGTSLDDLSTVIQINPDSLNLVVSYFVTDHQVTDIDSENADYEIDYPAQANETVLFITTLNFV